MAAGPPEPDRHLRLRLLAQDAADLQILSAALQDAVAQVADVRFEPAARRLVVLFNRFRWEGDASPGADPPGAGGERVRAALQLSGVLSVRSKRLRREAKAAVINLLALDFLPGEAPGGEIVATLSGGGEIRCEVECLDALLADVSDPWPTPSRPAHALEG